MVSLSCVFQNEMSSLQAMDEVRKKKAYQTLYCTLCGIIRNEFHSYL